MLPACAIAAPSSATERGRARRTSPAGPPPQPVTAALATGMAATAASARGMDSQRKQRQPDERAELEQPVVEKELLGRLTLTGRDERAVARDAGGERDDR